VHQFAIPIGILAGLLIAAVLWDGFETIVLPRRVRRRVRLTRVFYRITWVLWSVPARKLLSKSRMESVLAYYGPLSLLALIVVWAAALVFGFGLVNFSLGSSLSAYGRPSFITDLYMSGTTFFTLGLGDVRPVTTAARLTTVIEAGMGFGFLALLIAYLPALNQSFSRREADISMLDARAGSPPSAACMLERHDHDGGMDELQEQLSQWERWCAELLESHLSYPVLAYYRSQHDDQSWLAALTVMLDVSAVLMAFTGGTCARQAKRTFAIARHAVVDLAVVFNRPPERPQRDRLGEGGFLKLKSAFEASGMTLADPSESERKLDLLRRLYEPYVESLARHFLLSVPPWIPAPGNAPDWQRSPWEDVSVPVVDIIVDEWKDHHLR
jgi:voltage-gated potassium channel Kch